MTALLMYLPLPGSETDAAAAIFFLGLVSLIVFQVYQTRPKR
ncbi:MAG: hypothetical protein AAF722_13065 [Cyanobacteria bacterium P01_C01_bin.70]